MAYKQKGFPTHMSTIQKSPAKQWDWYDENVADQGYLAAAGTGARITLLNHKKRKEIEDIVKNVEKIETAVEKKFQEHFVNAMAFPHKIDNFQNLEKEVSLPKIGDSNNKSNNDTINKKRRRRRRRA